MDRLQVINEGKHDLELTQITELEAIEHALIIDFYCPGRRMTDEQIAQCRRRIIAFGYLQWKNRN